MPRSESRPDFRQYREAETLGDFHYDELDSYSQNGLKAGFALGVHSMRFSLYVLPAVLLAVLSLPGSAIAQPKPGYLPSSTHIFPAGAQRGTAVNVLVGAECTPPGTELLFHGEGIRSSQKLEREVINAGEPSPRRLPTITPITYPREWQANVSVAESAEPGVVYWRLHSAQGGTGSRPFIIGDLPEFIETEPNSTFTNAEEVALPVTVNGQINGERDLDCYRFRVSPGEVISCEVVAGRIGSPLDPVVELLDEDGNRLPARQFHIGTDPVLVLPTSKSTEYTLRISNVTFRGDPAFVYRINLRSFPAGTLQPPADLVPDNESQLALLTADKASFAADFVGLWTAMTSAPPAAQPDTAPHPTASEHEPNDDIASAERLAVPGVFYGRFATAEDRDFIRLSVAKDQRIRLACKAWPAGTSTLPTLQILKADGTSLSSIGRATGSDLAARLVWTSREGQHVFVKVQDLSFGSRGGTEFSYELLVEEDSPDFRLDIAADSLVVTQGKTSKVTVTANRLGGFNEPIELSTTGLPDGVTAEAVTIPAGKSQATLELAAADDASVQNGIVTIHGTAKVGEETIERVAQCRHLGADSEGVSIGSSTSERFYVSVQHKPLFRLFCSEAYLYAHRGSVFEYDMEVERLNGFDGPIFLQRGDRQNRDLDGVEIWDATVKPGESKVILPIYLPETMSINVQSQTQLYSQAWARFEDSSGKEQTMLVLSEKRNMLRSMPTVVKLTAMDETLTASPGETLTCRFLLQRTSNFPGPMQLSLVNSEWSGEARNPVSIAAGQTEISIAVQLPDSRSSGDLTPLHFRATGTLPNGTHIITQAKIEVEIADR